MRNDLFTSTSELLDTFRDDVWNGSPPVRWPLGMGPLAQEIDFGPGELVVIGGAPGAGKTAFATAGLFDAVRATPGLKALVVNVEMTPAALLNRQLARLSGISLNTISRREVNMLGASGKQRIHDAMSTLASVAPRVAFLEAPFTTERIAEAMDAFGAECLLLDYVQRICVPSASGSAREGLEGLMSSLRQFTQNGAGVLALSAVARQSGKAGSNYDGLGLASFRGSSELEFAADSCYVLTPLKDSKDRVALTAAKRRNGELQDIKLKFERAYQRFLPLSEEEPPTEGEGGYDDDDADF